MTWLLFLAWTGVFFLGGIWCGWAMFGQDWSR